jgi:hypothetical protein
MDPWTERVTLRRDDLDLRWVDARSALVLPPQDAAWWVTLDITPVDPVLARWAGLDPARVLAEGQIVPRGGTEHQDQAPVYYAPAYTVHALDVPLLRSKIEGMERWTAVGADPFAPTPLADPPEFGGLVRLAGYQWLSPLGAGAQAELLTAWRVLDAGPSATRYGEPALRTFFHLLTPDQTVVAGVDVLGVAADTWLAGDTLIQLHRLTLPQQAGTYAVEIGWYVPPTGPRLSIAGAGHGAGADRVLLAPAVVQ